MKKEKYKILLKGKTVSDNEVAHSVDVEGRGELLIDAVVSAMEDNESVAQLFIFAVQTYVERNVLNED